MMPLLPFSGRSQARSGARSSALEGQMFPYTLRYGLSALAGLIILLNTALAGAAETPDPKVAKAGHQHKSWYSNTKAHKEGDPNCGCVGCYARPYRTSSCLYGYQDHAYGRGPLINLGGAALQPGFRGYGVIGSPGYGLGLAPSSLIDARANAKGWKLIP